MRNNPCPICKNPIKDLLIIDVDEKSNNINFNNDNNIDEGKDGNIIEVNENNNIINNFSNNDNMVDDEEKIKIKEEE